MADPLFITETQILNEVANNPECRFKWTSHARQSIADDGRTTLDIEKGLMKCRVVLEEWKKDRLWRARGRDLDGGEFEAVVAVYEDEIVIKVVTTFSV